MKKYQVLTFMSCLSLLVLGCGQEDNSEETEVRCVVDEECYGVFEEAETHSVVCDTLGYCTTKCRMGTYRDDLGKCVRITEDILEAEKICNIDDEECDKESICPNKYEYDEVFDKCFHEGCGRPVGYVTEQISPVKNGNIYEFDTVCAFSLDGIGNYENVRFSNLKYLKKFEFSSKYVRYSDGHSIGNSKTTSIEFSSLEYAANISMIENIYNKDSSLSVKFPALKKASYIHIADNSYLNEIEFEALERVDSICVENTQLERLSFPMLEKSRRLWVRYNSNLSEMNFPHLDELSPIERICSNCSSNTDIIFSHGLSIWDNDKLKTLKFSKLFTISDISIGENDELNSVVFTRLNNVNSVEIQLHLNLETIDFGLLESVRLADGDDGYDGILLYNNIALQNVKIPKLSSISSIQIINEVASDHNKDATKLYLDSLEEMDGGLSLLASTTDIFAPKLQTVGSMFLYETMIKTLNFPLLKTVTDNLTIWNNYELEEIYMPELDNVGELDYINNPLVTNKIWKIEE